MRREILTFPDPFLKRKASEAKNIDGQLVSTVDDMVETMYAAPGVGLAAPQIGVLTRVIVIDIDHENKGKQLIKLINPEVVETEGQVIWEEGCLSVIDFTAEVKRAARVVVRGWTPAEKEVDIEATDLLAVALQHEIDHLDGKLFLDRISSLKRDLYRRRVAKQKRLKQEGPRGPRADKRPLI